MTENEAKAVRFIEYIKKYAVETIDHIAKEDIIASTVTYTHKKEKAETILAMVEELKKYRAIGTPEECRAAMERQNPIAAIAEKEDTGTTKYTCQACGRYMGWSTGTLPARYCWKCGQKLDWGDEE
mgnify:FL=1